MKETKLSVKAIVCLAWLLIGVAAIFVGIFLNVPDADVQLRIFMITSDASVARAMFESASFGALLTLKYLLIVAGLVVAAVASIGLAGAMETSKLESLMFDDGEYDYDDIEECAFDCASCGAECESREEETEDAVEEVVEEIAEETAEEPVEESTEE